MSFRSTLAVKPVNPTADVKKTHRNNKSQSKKQTERPTSSHTLQLQTLQGTHNNSLKTVHQTHPDLSTHSLAAALENHNPQQTKIYTKCCSTHGYRQHQNNIDQSRPSRYKSSQPTGPYGHERHTLLKFLHRTRTLNALSHPQPLAKPKQIENPSSLLLQIL